MRGDLVESFAKGGRTVTRTMEADRDWTAPDGAPFTLHGRSVMFVRNVGHLMTTPMIRLPDGRSEEHTSELQSLMRISYAVFCLKKKTTQNTQSTVITLQQ